MKKNFYTLCFLMFFAFVVACGGGCSSTSSDCNSTEKKGSFSFFAPPEVKLQLNKTKIFIAARPFKLSGGTPAGGEFSGDGVENGKFFPEKAGAGEHTITYTFKNVSATGIITVLGPKTKKANPNCGQCHGSGKVMCNPKITCTGCHGKKEFWDHSCSNCKGTGKVRAWYKCWFGTKDCSDCAGRGCFYRDCSDCKGTGQEKCPFCKGTGKKPCDCLN